MSANLGRRRCLAGRGAYTQAGMVGHLLVVDDAAPIRTRLRQILEEAGYRVSEAENGAVALDLLDEPGIDMLLVDVNMPVVGGLEFIERARQQPDYRDTPIFVLTAESRPEVVQRCRELGVTAWLVKPIKPEVLLRGLARVLAA
ncbi:MAG: response regulator [Myxococcales bacterium FL481]|nr:MAG: response regulator [Myxococcales bacterium FL481]